MKQNESCLDGNDCNYKTTLKRSIFKGISWLKGSFFDGEHRDFLKEEA
jgi:hypothetical protein